MEEKAFVGEDIGGLYATAFADADKIPLVKGEKYTVTFNGEKYVCECYEFMEGLSDFLVIGNGSFEAADFHPDTGEPFCYYYSPVSTETIMLWKEEVGANVTFGVIEGADEPDTSISYIEYLVKPEYRKFPFKGLIGWLLHRGGE